MTIDWWTLGIQTINVAILVWLLQRFFWRPVAAIIEQRRDATRSTLTEATATRAQATEALAEIERTRAGFAAERESILAAANAAAEAAKTALLADARQAAAALEASAKAAIEAQRRAAEHDWADSAAQLAVAIAARLMARLDAAAVRAAFLGWLIDGIVALPEAERRSIVASGVALEVTSAKALDPAEQADAREAIGKALGGTISLAFNVDPTLIAGVELRGPHLRVSNSWRADLAEIQAHLTPETAPA
jgi:F-type H+-transporting ATPase subunit b